MGLRWIIPGMASIGERKVRLTVEEHWVEANHLTNEHATDWLVFKRDLELGIGRPEIVGTLGFEILEGPEGKPVFFKSLRRVYKDEKAYGRLGVVLSKDGAWPALLTGLIYDFGLDPGLDLADIDPDTLKLAIIGNLHEDDSWELRVEDILPIILPRQPGAASQGVQICLLIDRGLMKQLKLKTSV